MILTGSRPAQTKPAAHFLWKRNVKDKIKVNKSRCQKPIDFEEVFCYILVENKEKGNNNLCWH